MKPSLRGDSFLPPNIINIANTEKLHNLAKLFVNYFKTTDIIIM